MKDKNTELVYSKNVLEVITVANEFCLFIEEVDKYNKEFILSYLQKVLPLLYLKGSLLPDVKVENEEANERYVTEEHWQNIYLALKKKLGKDDTYWNINNSDEISDNGTEIKPIKASLAENLADIYQDLKDFLVLYQKPLTIAKENAVCECKNLFETHWGFRVVNTHKAVHYILFKNKNTEDEDFYS